MVNESGARGDDPQALLSATRDLTHRVRIAQRGAWFSLLAFAGVTFTAIPFTRYGDHPAHCSSIHGGGYVCSVHSALALWYWPIALLAAYLATAWFSVRRAEHRGVGTRAQPFVVVGAVLTMLATVWAFWADAHPAFLAGTLRLQPGQPTQFLYRVASPAGAVGLALLLLASIERSRLLFTIAVAYVIVAVATVGVDWFPRPTPWAFLPHLLIDGGVLLIGAILVAATQRTAGPSNA